jgi:protein transport protein SEC61 subunit beta
MHAAQAQHYVDRMNIIANNHATQSAPRPTSPVDSATTTGSTTGRPSSPKPPGGPATAIRRKAASDLKEKAANARSPSTRAAGAGGSSATMLKLYTDESPGLKVDPFVVMVLSIGFIISVVMLHSECSVEGILGNRRA